MAIPIYYKIYKDLQYKICSGELAPGEELPIDAELEKIYGVSRAPIRQALESLNAEGLIVRGAGRRTCVAAKARTFPWLPGSGFLEHYEREWARMTCQTHVLEMAEPPEVARKFLNLEQGTQAIHMIRTRCVAETSVILIHNYLPPKYSLDVLKAAGNFTGLKEVLFSNYNKDISNLRESLAVRAVPEPDAKLLQVPANSYHLQIYRYTYDENELPFVFDIRYARTDIWRYDVSFQHRHSLCAQKGSANSDERRWRSVQQKP